MNNNGGEGGVNTVTAMGTVTDNNPLKAAAKEAAVDTTAAILAATVTKTMVATARTMRTKAATVMMTAATTTMMTAASAGASTAAAATATAGATDNNQLKVAAKETAVDMTARQLGGGGGGTNGNGNGKGW